MVNNLREEATVATKNSELGFFFFWCFFFVCIHSERQEWDFPHHAGQAGGSNQKSTI